MQEKTEILLVVLEERYVALHKIRERLQGICFWVLGIFFALSGWIMQSNLTISINQKIFLSVSIFIAFIYLRFYYLRDLCNGFKNQQKITVRIEEALNLYKSKYFTTKNESIFPNEWKNSGTDNSPGRFFDTNYVLLYIGTFFLIITIWLKGML